jgi:hypothetical protein
MPCPLGQGDIPWKQFLNKGGGYKNYTIDLILEITLVIFSICEKSII